MHSCTSIVWNLSCSSCKSQTKSCALFRWNDRLCVPAACARLDANLCNVNMSIPPMFSATSGLPSQWVPLLGYPAQHADLCHGRTWQNPVVQPPSPRSGFKWVGFPLLLSCTCTIPFDLVVRLSLPEDLLEKRNDSHPNPGLQLSIVETKNPGRWKRSLSQVDIELDRDIKGCKMSRLRGSSSSLHPNILKRKLILDLKSTSSSCRLTSPGFCDCKKGHNLRRRWGW